MSNIDVSQITAEVQHHSQFIEKLIQEVQKVIVGQQYLIERLLIGLLADGHILLEGVPGLAKTTAVKALASAIDTRFQRIQFTPDMLPADLTGTMIYDQKEGTFKTNRGPLFANLILADEINRAPAKVQSALLEAMQERQITLGAQTLMLDDPFLVLATQNPIEQEGTYPLPEAQVDRFMLKLTINYPSKEEELKILKRMSFTRKKIDVQKVISPEEIIQSRNVVDQIYMDEKLQQYIVNLVDATRNPGAYGLSELKPLVQFGASPRATINLTVASKAHAFLNRRGFVTPEDVKSIGLDVMRHRVIVSYEAEAEEITSDDIVRKIFDSIEVP